MFLIVVMLVMVVMFWSTGADVCVPRFLSYL